MTPERFREIIEAYGTLPQRWPDAERAAAEDFLRKSPEAREALAREASLDGLLDSYRVAPPNSMLIGAIVASFPSLRHLWWVSLLKGVGFVGAGLAGAIAGAFLMMIYAPVVPTVIDDNDRPIFTSFDIGMSDFDLGDTQ